MKHFPLTGLHSDVLEEKYGPIIARVLKHTSRIRESLMVDKNGITRTYALTFLNKMKGEIKEINDKIKAGRPIGKAFRDRGYIIRKNVLDVFTIKIPTWLREEFRTEEKYAKARLAEFYAKREGTSPIIYGIVTEVYSPDFRKPKVNKVDKLQESAPTYYLEKEGFTREEIWRRIGDANNYEGVERLHREAIIKSKVKVKMLREQVKREIQFPK